jgi:branched-chain amino acid transport system ATP-binding protein
MARVFQNTALFSNLTVLDNVLLGKHISLDYGLLAASWHYGKARKSEIQQRKKVEEIIDFLEMGVIRKELVGNLSFGLKKKVELARALAMDPKILFLDEPASGMNQEEKEDIVRFVLSIRRSRDIPIVIIEHDMNVVMNISDRVTVMSHGRKIAEGTSQSVQKNPSVIEAYLGEKRV